MKEAIGKVYIHAVTLFLGGIASFCVRHAVSFRQFVAIAKQAFIVAARAELRERGAKESVSKLCVMTGLQRGDIGSLLASEIQPDKVENNLIRSLIAQWRGDPRFLTPAGRPKPLSTDTLECEFAELLRILHSDLNHHTVLFELERLGAIERKGNVAILRASFFEPKGDARRAYELLASDMRDLMHAVEENVSADRAVNLHAKTEYDNIPAAHLPTLQAWLIRQGTAFHRRIRTHLSKYDRDYQGARPVAQVKDDTTRVRVGIGTFSYAERVPEERS